MNWGRSLDLGKQPNFGEYFCNPFEIYIELEEFGEGAYGVVKKVCLIDNPDTIRAMKIIPKENIVRNCAIPLPHGGEFCQNQEIQNGHKIVLM